MPHETDDLPPLPAELQQMRELGRIAGPDTVERLLREYARTAIAKATAPVVPLEADEVENLKRISARVATWMEGNCAGEPPRTAIAALRTLADAMLAASSPTPAPVAPPDLYYGLSLDEVKQRLALLKEDDLRGFVVSLLIQQRIRDKVEAASPPAPAPVVPIAERVIASAEGSAQAGLTCLTFDGARAHLEALRDNMAFFRELLAASPPAPAPVVPPGLAVEQEPKYTVNGHAIVNRASGEAVPADEPVFMFRARDVHAREAIEAYACVLPPGAHRDAVVQRVGDFAAFAHANPSRMKEPDTDQEGRNV